jgi:hypothetical protein
MLEWPRHQPPREAHPPPPMAPPVGQPRPKCVLSASCLSVATVTVLLSPPRADSSLAMIETSSLVNPLRRRYSVAFSPQSAVVYANDSLAHSIDAPPS